MRLKPTLALLLIAVLAAAYFFLVEQPRHKRGVERMASAGRLAEVFPDAVDRVEISRQDVDISFDRHMGHWRMVTPVIDRADDSSVNTLLYSIARATIERHIETSPTELAEFGLDPPEAEVTITGKLNGKTVRVRVLVGNLSLTKSHCYTRLEGTDGVSLAPAGIRRYAMRSLFEFRNKRITEVSVDQLTRIMVASRGQSIDWQKSDSHGWITVQHGDSIRGDSSAVVGIAKRLRGLRAKNILTKNRRTVNELFASGDGSVSMWTDDDASAVVIEFGNKKNGRCYVSNSADERVALVDTTALRVFRWTVKELRNKRLLDFDTRRAAKLTLDTDSRSATIIKTDSDWAFANPEFGRVDQTRAGRLLNTIHTLEFENVVEEHPADMEAYGFYKPSFELTVYDRNDVPIDRMTVGRQIGESPYLYVTSFSSGVLARIDSATTARLANDFHRLGTE
jgi:hypothetical protein